MTEARRLTDEEQKWADATMDNTKAWLVPSLRAAAGRLAESRACEGELVAALALFPKIAGCHRKRLLLADAEVECDHCDKLMAEIRELCALGEKE
jgi:hypothetical protein